MKVYWRLAPVLTRSFGISWVIPLSVKSPGVVGDEMEGIPVKVNLSILAEKLFAT